MTEYAWLQMAGQEKGTIMEEDVTGEGKGRHKYSTNSTHFPLHVDLDLKR